MRQQERERQQRAQLLSRSSRRVGESALTSPYVGYADASVYAHVDVYVCIALDHFHYVCVYVSVYR